MMWMKLTTLVLAVAIERDSERDLESFSVCINMKRAMVFDQ